MLVDDTRFETILKDNNLVVTKVRKALYHALAGHNRSVDINTLVTALSGSIDRSSVYRNVELFEKIGIIKKVYSGWKYRLELSEKFRPHHHHFTCDNCNRVISIHLGNMLEFAILNFGKKQNLQIKSHEIELRGLCGNCC